jgi:iron complex outermembrane receptor protein
MNTGSFTNKGFEVECKYLITDRLTLSANYSYLHTTSEKLLAAPKNMLNTEANFTPGNFAVTVQTNSVWRLNTGADKLQDYTLLNMRIAFRHRISPFVKVDNITNKRYEIVYGCPMPGTTVIGGVQIKL